jgi:catechol 2,3-dioxygenase-like lactoylglutathione lyase family enzyme
VTGTRIAQASTVIVPVSDQERALDFYVQTLGFEKVLDFDYTDGERWIEVSPRGAATSLTLALVHDGEPIGIETRLVWDSADLEADHESLRARGVDVDTVIMRAGDPVVRWGGATLAGQPPMFLLRDPDGNSFLVVQRPS